MALWEVCDPCIPLARLINITATGHEEIDSRVSFVDCRLLCVRLCLQIRFDWWISRVFRRRCSLIWHCRWACYSQLRITLPLSPCKMLYTQLEFTFVLGQERVVNRSIVEVDSNLRSKRHIKAFEFRVLNWLFISFFARVNNSSR